MDADWKRRRVLDLLDALVAGQRQVLKSYLADDCRIIFPGFSASGHEGIDALYELLDAAFDGCPTKTYDRWVVDDRAVVISGRLQGRFKDGRVLDGTRYTDQFFFNRSGKVTDWLVWNDLALLPSA